MCQFAYWAFVESLLYTLRRQLSKVRVWVVFSWHLIVFVCFCQRGHVLARERERERESISPMGCDHTTVLFLHFSSCQDSRHTHTCSLCALQATGGFFELPPSNFHIFPYLLFWSVFQQYQKYLFLDNVKTSGAMGPSWFGCILCHTANFPQWVISPRSGLALRYSLSSVLPSAQELRYSGGQMGKVAGCEEGTEWGGAPLWRLAGSTPEGQRDPLAFPWMDNCPWSRHQTLKWPQ